MGVGKSLMSDLQISQGNYDKFHKWYCTKYGKEIYNNYEDFYHFLVRVADLETFHKVQDEIEEWRRYKSKTLKSVAAVEEHLLNWTYKYLQGLQDYGYIYYVRNLAIGDSSEFTDGENKYSVRAQVYKFNIGESLSSESSLDVKKRNIQRLFSESLANILEEKVAESSINGSLGLFKRSVKMVFEDLIILETEDGHEVAVKLGIKTI